MSTPKPMYTLSLDSPSSDLSTTGGKGHNLAVLSRDGNFPVPPGFVVTVAAYHQFLSETGLLREIEKALSTGLHKNISDSTEGVSTADLETLSKKIRDAFRRKKLSTWLRAEIGTRLDELLPDTKVNVAVRSSATCEDMPDASFAGQHDTYLNVSRNTNNVCKHVIDCFGSLFTSRAISYRERNGISHTHAGMAVVVQALVSSDCSGVLFTANPLTGRRTESVLEAIPGLGEALVSGLTEPDRYIVSRGMDGDISIKDARVGAKMKAIRPVEGGGVKEECAEAANGQVLTDEEVKEIIELGQKVEALFGSSNPQDIEWARTGDKTYIVQSRPITTLFPLPKNVGPADELKVYFSFGAIQGITGAMYPAGQEAIQNLFSGIIRWISWGRKGKKTANILAERLYPDVTPILRNSIGRKIICKLLAAVEPGILAGFKEILDDPRLEIDSGLSPLFFFRLLSLYSTALPRFIFTMLFPDWSRKRMIARTHNIVRDVKEAAERATNLLEVVDLKETILQNFFRHIIPHFIPRMASGFAPLAMLTHLASSVSDGKDIVLTITRGLPHNVTTEMDLELWQVAKIIQSDPKSYEHFFSEDVDTLADDYLGGRLPGKAQDAVRRFMADYGMRGLCEIDFGRPRWRDEPAPLMQTLKSYMEIDEDNAPDKMFAKGEGVSEEAVLRLGKELGKPRLVRFLASRYRAIGGLRELPKFTIIRIMGILREKFLQEGEKLVKAGTLDTPSDVFVLHHDELRALVKGEPTDWKALVAERKATMKRESERTRLPRVVTSDGFGYYGGAVSKMTAAEGDNILGGEPVSPGTVEGKVRVILDPSKTKLMPGEILVCHGTDPSWTPLFLAAGGLCMEVGGLMTHGSVVAREYGIPAVVGLEKVTERLQTGQLIRVDGSSGVVEILKEA